MKKEKLPQMKSLMAANEPDMQALSAAIEVRLEEVSQALKKPLIYRHRLCGELLN
jgi:hypothetical protein